MTTQQIQAIRWITMLGAALLSVAVPILLVRFDLGGELTLAMFAPGLLVMSPVHNVLPALIVTVVVDAIVYCAVVYFVVWSILRITQKTQHAQGNGAQIHGDVEQIVGPERDGEFLNLD